MAIPTLPEHHARRSNPSPMAPASAEWRCLECGKLLGMRRGAKLHVRLQGHDYMVSLPVEAFCRGCGTRNRT